MDTFRFSRTRLMKTREKSVGILDPLNSVRYHDTNHPPQHGLHQLCRESATIDVRTSVIHKSVLAGVRFNDLPVEDLPIARLVSRRHDV